MEVSSLDIINVWGLFQQAMELPEGNVRLE